MQDDTRFQGFTIQSRPPTRLRKQSPPSLDINYINTNNSNPFVFANDNAKAPIPLLTPLIEAAPPLQPEFIQGKPELIHG